MLTILRVLFYRHLDRPPLSSGRAGKDWGFSLFLLRQELRSSRSSYLPILEHAIQLEEIESELKDFVSPRETAQVVPHIGEYPALFQVCSKKGLRKRV